MSVLRQGNKKTCSPSPALWLVYCGETTCDIVNHPAERRAVELSQGTEGDLQPTVSEELVPANTLWNEPPGGSSPSQALK